MSQVLEPGQRAMTPTEICQLAMQAWRIMDRERRANMPSEEHPKNRPRAKPAKPFVDSLGLIERGFTRQDAVYHYAWELRHRMLGAYRANRSLTFREIGEAIGVGACRVGQMINHASSEERHVGNGTPVTRFLKHRSFRQRCACGEPIARDQPLRADQCDDCYWAQADAEAAE